MTQEDKYVIEKLYIMDVKTSLLISGLVLVKNKFIGWYVYGYIGDVSNDILPSSYLVVPTILYKK